jgi:nitrogen-specific signal transduction histidine kinase
MKRNMNIILAFTTLFTFASGVFAQTVVDDSSQINDIKIGFSLVPFGLVDADKNNEITFEEFKKASEERFVLIDTSKDSKLSVQELTVLIKKKRAEKIAQRVIKRFDSDNDGFLITSEIESQQKKIYDRLDRNKDGKLLADEVKSKVKKTRTDMRHKKTTVDANQ